MKKIVLTFGIISGLISMAWMITLAALGFDCMEMEQSEVIGYTILILSSVMIGAAVYTHREKHLGGVISFGKAFQVGILVALISAFMYVVTWEIEYHFFVPGFVDEFAQHMIEKVKSSDKSEAEIQEALKQMDQFVKIYKTWWGNILLTLMEPLQVSIPATLVVALVFKRKTPKIKTVN